MKRFLILFLVISTILTGCTSRQTIVITGSSTVYPITLEAQSDYLDNVNKDSIITVESTGTGGGFELFTKGESAINDASRAIHEEELATLEENNINYEEYNIGTDGITVIINNENDWAKDLTQEQLKEAFNTNSQVTKWSDLDPSFPDEKIDFYGPTSASGTYDFFVEAIIGDTESAIRADMNATENDNEIISNIEKDKYGIGFLGYSYYSSNNSKVQSVAIDGVSPNTTSIKNGEYILSRPLFIYVNKDIASENEDLTNFVNYYIENSQEFVKRSGYIPLNDEEQKQLEKKML